MLAWTDEDLPLEKILEEVTLYWLTDTAPRTFYHNRSVSVVDTLIPLFPQRVELTTMVEMADAGETPKMARISLVSVVSSFLLPGDIILTSDQLM